jgi:hypothetical protein
MQRAAMTFDHDNSKAITPLSFLMNYTDIIVTRKMRQGEKNKNKKHCLVKLGIFRAMHAIIANRSQKKPIHV